MRLLLAAAATMLSAPQPTSQPVPQPARAAEASPASAQEAEQLHVELVLNGVETGALVELGVLGDALVADAAALRAAGVRLDPREVAAGVVNLSGVRGFAARYDAALQQLVLNVPADRLPVQRLAHAADPQPEAMADPGFLLGYDAYVRRTNGRTTASLWTEQRLFGAAGILSSTGVLRAGETGSGYLRYDTAVQFVDQRRMATLVAGDLVTGALPWNGAVRMGGVQLARSFRVRPDLVTMPLPRFQGEAAVPSGVDLLVNGSPAGHHDVAPGRYVLNDLPAVTGAGDVTVVTTDAVGRQVATTARFYVAPELLRPGLTDFSLEAGLLRRRYGQSSFRYGRAVASGTVRRGLTPRLTAEFHGEGASDLAMAGAGLAWSPGRWGTVQGAVAESRAGFPSASGPGRTSGRQWMASYSYMARSFTVGAQHLDRDGGFRDLASLDFDLALLPGQDRSRSSHALRSDRVWGSAVLGRLGSLGAAYAAARAPDGTHVRLLSATWSAAVGNRLSAFATVSHDAGRGGTSGQVRLLLPLGRTSVGAGIGAEPGRGWTMRASYARARSSKGGLGLAADGAVDEHGRGLGQASASWQLPTVRLEAGAAHAPGGTSLWAGAGGALIAMGGGVFRTAVVPNAFAVVATGVAGVPVRYENQMVGVTNRSGALLVAAASAFQPGRYAIDTLDLPAGMTANRTEVAAALRGGSGAVIRLPVRAGRSALAVLVDAEGQVLEPGDVAELPDGRVLPVGWDGELVLEDAAEKLAITVRRRGGQSCRADISVPDGPAFQRLEAVSCR